MFRRIVIQLFIFLMLFSTWWEIENMRHIAAGGRVTGQIPLFPKLQVEMLKSPKTSLAAQALEETARMLINYLEPELAREIWDCRFLFINLLGDKEEELIISLSLMPDRGVLALLQKQNNHYVLLYSLDNLLPITKMERILLPEGREILSTREEHQERIGSYSESKMVKLWAWKGNSLHMVWSDNAYWELNWLNTWQNPQSEPLKWFKLIHEAGISFRAEPKPSIVTKANQSYYECPAAEKVLPPQQQFKLISTRQVNEEYYWNEEWQRFIINTATLSDQADSSNERVAILKDMDNHLESLAVRDKRMYEVIGQNGRIFLVEKSRVKVDS